MTVASARPARLLLVLLAALLAAGCGSSGVDERRLIAQSRAAEMVEDLDRAERDLQARRCGRATNAIESLRNKVGNLPQRTDGKLVANLTEWVTHLEERVPADCEAAREAEQEEEETPTPTPTKTPDKDEEQEEETPTPTPTPTVTATPVPQPTPIPTPPPTGGGTGEGGQGGGGDEGGGGDDGGGGSDQPSTGGVPPGDEASP